MLQILASGNAETRLPSRALARRTARTCCRKLKERRLALTLKTLKERKITLVIDETRDRKKAHKTDYVSRHYLGSVGKIDNGIVSVNAYGIYKNLTFPLMFKVLNQKGH